MRVAARVCQSRHKRRGGHTHGDGFAIQGKIARLCHRGRGPVLRHGFSRDVVGGFCKREEEEPAWPSEGDFDF